MSDIKRLDDIIHQATWPTEAIKQKVLQVIDSFDDDLDKIGFDTSTTTDDLFDELEALTEVVVEEPEPVVAEEEDDDDDDDDAEEVVAEVDVDDDKDDEDDEDEDELEPEELLEDDDDDEDDEELDDAAAEEIAEQDEVLDEEEAVTEVIEMVKEEQKASGELTGGSLEEVAEEKPQQQ